MSTLRKISILGSTGSVGRSTIDVIKEHPHSFEVQALTAQRNVEQLALQAKELNARHAVIADETLYNDLKDALSGTCITPSAGRKALIEAASLPADIIMAAIVGIAGLEPVMRAIKQGTCVVIANKEPLVAAGSLIMAEAQKHKATLLPVDSEHNAIFQVFEEKNRKSIERLIITASGGPFRTWTTEQMEQATPEQAVAHPNWSMGAKISVDSATMMNKALEIIEAHHLFAMPANKIDILVHPQSVIHSMVEYEDGSLLAQLGAPDMRTPITYALSWPERLRTPGQKLNFRDLKRLDFEDPDPKRFPAIQKAYDCLSAGQSSCIAFNAANEVAVEKFLNKEIGFLDIVRTVSHITENLDPQKIMGLQDVIDLDKHVRNMTNLQFLKNCA